MRRFVLACALLVLAGLAGCGGGSAAAPPTLVATLPATIIGRWSATLTGGTPVQVDILPGGRVTGFVGAALVTGAADATGVRLSDGITLTFMGGLQGSVYRVRADVPGQPSKIVALERVG